MQFYFSLLVFWTCLLLSLRVGVWALPIPSSSTQARIETRNSEAVVSNVQVVEPRLPIQPEPRVPRVLRRRPAGSRANRLLKRARVDIDPSARKLSKEIFSPVNKRAQSGSQVKRLPEAEVETKDDTPSTSSTASAPKETALVSCADLFPVSSSKSWTSCPGAPKSLPMTMDIFGKIHHVNTALSRTIGPAPDGKPALIAKYKKGSYALQTPNGRPNGGISFFAPGQKDVVLTTAKEATFGYSVFFPSDFDFVLAGKLPGLYGGDTEDSSIGCGGGIRTTKCWSARLMWREQGAGELYPYLPSEGTFKTINDKACEAAISGSHGTCKTDWGMSIGTGSYKWKRGAWTTVSQRVRLNDLGKANGEMEVFVEGKSVIKLNNISLRTTDEARIRGMMVQSFFGGSSKPDYATPKDQQVFFSDFSIAITELL